MFLPAGTDKKKLRTTWRNLMWARATENLAVVVTTQNLFSESERGMALVAAFWGIWHLVSGLALSGLWSIGVVKKESVL